jgi:PAS domain S-box-containing protein
MLDGETSVIAADSSHRITFVADAAARLLGWQSTELLGRRLTAIIPPRLREAHLAGFTRFHVTGETRVLGRCIRVPALRKDGSELDVDLFIEAARRPGGAPALRAVLTPAE